MPEQTPTLTLITPSEQNLLSENRLKTLLSTANLEGQIRWLKKGDAADINLNQPIQNIEATKQSITKAIADQPIDFALQTTSTNRRKQLLISDMDSTIIEEECIDEIAFMAGIKPKIADITERAMRGEINFDSALKERVELLKGLETDALETVINERLHLTKGARTLVQTMAKHGAHCALVSGGFTYFTQRIANLAGFHTTQANILDIKENKLTGKVIPPILGSTAKKLALESLSKEKKVDHQKTLAVGDGANDLEMITHASLGIAYKAKPIVAEKATAAIIHTDLTSILYMQGYKHEEFATNT